MDILSKIIPVHLVAEPTHIVVAILAKLIHEESFRKILISNLIVLGKFELYNIPYPNVY